MATLFLSSIYTATHFIKTPFIELICATVLGKKGGPSQKEYFLKGFHQVAKKNMINELFLWAD